MFNYSAKIPNKRYDSSALSVTKLLQTIKILVTHVKNNSPKAKAPGLFINGLF